MKTKAMFLTTALCCACGAAEQTRETSLNGSWVLQNDPTVSITVDENAGKIHVVEKKGADTTMEYACAPDGQDCKGKDEGHGAKISLWFNGPKLVELESRGSHVVRRRFVPAADGKTLTVEISAISPKGKDEKLEFIRQ